MLKLIVIQKEISDDEILAVAKDLENAYFETWQEFGAMLRCVLPRLLEGWTAVDIDEMTFADLKSLPEHLAQAVQLRQTPIKPPHA